MMVLDYGVLAHGGINLFLKIIGEFRNHILAVHKPTRVIYIQERYIIDEFCTDIDLYSVKGIKQKSSEFGIKLIKIINAFECSARF